MVGNQKLEAIDYSLWEYGMLLACIKSMEAYWGNKPESETIVGLVDRYQW